MVRTAILIFLAFTAHGQSYLHELSNAVATAKLAGWQITSGPAAGTWTTWKEPARIPEGYTLWLPADGTPSTATASPAVEAPSAAAEQWLRARYAPERWNGVKWFIISPRGFALPVEAARNVAPGMTLPLIGLLPRGYTGQLPPEGNGAPDAAPYLQVPVFAGAVNGWTSPDVLRNPVTREAYKTYASAQAVIIPKLGRFIFAEPTIPSSARLATMFP